MQRPHGYLGGRGNPVPRRDYNRREEQVRLYTIYVGRIPHQCHEGQLRAMFCEFGDIYHLFLFRPSSLTMTHTYAFIRYTDETAVHNAVVALNGKILMGSPLLVERSNKPFSTEQLRKINSHHDRKNLPHPLRMQEDRQNLHHLKEAYVQVHHGGSHNGRLPSLPVVMDKVNSQTNSLVKAYSCEFGGIQLDLDTIEQLYKDSLSHGDDLLNTDTKTEGASLLNRNRDATSLGDSLGHEIKTKESSTQLLEIDTAELQHLAFSMGRGRATTRFQ